MSFGFANMSQLTIHTVFSGGICGVLSKLRDFGPMAGYIGLILPFTTFFSGGGSDKILCIFIEQSLAEV